MLTSHSLEFREDGRNSLELRKIDISRGKIGNNGFVELRQGNSWVRAVCSGPKDGSKLIFKIIYSLTSRQEPINEKRIYEYENELYGIFDKVVLCDNQIEVSLEIFQEDGSILSTMINCITLVLSYSAVPLLDMCCSVTFSETSVDLTNAEENQRQNIMMLVYLMNRKKIISFKSHGRTTKDKLRKAFVKGLTGCEKVYREMRSFFLEKDNSKNICMK